MTTTSYLRTLGVLVLLASAGLPAQTLPVSTVDRATALTEARTGDWTRADAVLQAAADATPPDVEACVLLTQRRLEQRRHKEAVGLAERAAQTAPDSAAVQALLGRALGARIGELAFLQQGEMAVRMLKAFQRAVELDPNHVPALVGLGSYYLSAPEIAGGSLERAEEYAVRAEKLDVGAGAVLAGRIRERQQRWREAAECYGRAAAAQPRNPWLYSQVGAVLAKAGDATGARAAFAQALQLAPDYAAAKEGLQALDAAAAGGMP